MAWLAKRGGSPHSLDNVPSIMYSACSVSYFLAMLFSNLALEWINYPTQVLGKSCKPIPIMAFGVLFAGKQYAWRKYAYVLMIVVGMAVFLYKPDGGGGRVKEGGASSSSSHFQFGAGEMLLVASLAMDGATGGVGLKFEQVSNSQTSFKKPTTVYLSFRCYTRSNPSLLSH